MIRVHLKFSKLYKKNNDNNNIFLLQFNLNGKILEIYKKKKITL